METRDEKASVWRLPSLSPSIRFVKLFSNSHANVRKKSNIANRLKSHCERSHAISERSHANLKQMIACDSRIANEMETGLLFWKSSTKNRAGSFWHDKTPCFYS